MKTFNRIVATLGLMLSAGVLHAAEDSVVTGWQTSLVFDITATQAQYSDSWTGGEAGSVNWVSNLLGSAEKQMSPEFNFKSTLKLSFGQTLSQDKDTKDWLEPAKSTDLIDWENIGRITMGGFVDPFAALRLETQFLDASVDGHDRYLNPMRLTASAGFAKVLHKRDKNKVLTRLGLAVKRTMDKQFINANFDTETVSATDAGIESVTDATIALSEQATYTGKLSLFKSFSFSEKDAAAGTVFENDWKSIDVNLENIITAKVTKILAVNFYTQILYDKQISRKARIKETLGMGLVVKLN